MPNVLNHKWASCLILPSTICRISWLFCRAGGRRVDASQPQETDVLPLEQPEVVPWDVPVCHTIEEWHLCQIWTIATVTVQTEADAVVKGHHSSYNSSWLWKIFYWFKLTCKLEFVSTSCVLLFWYLISVSFWGLVTKYRDWF